MPEKLTHDKIIYYGEIGRANIEYLKDRYQNTLDAAQLAADKVTKIYNGENNETPWSSFAFNMAFELGLGKVNELVNKRLANIMHKRLTLEEGTAKTLAGDITSIAGKVFDEGKKSIKMPSSLTENQYPMLLSHQVEHNMPILVEREPLKIVFQNQVAAFGHNTMIVSINQQTELVNRLAESGASEIEVTDKELINLGSKISLTSEELAVMKAITTLTLLVDKHSVDGLARLYNKENKELGAADQFVDAVYYQANKEVFEDIIRICYVLLSEGMQKKAEQYLELRNSGNELNKVVRKSLDAIDAVQKGITGVDVPAVWNTLSNVGYGLGPSLDERGVENNLKKELSYEIVKILNSFQENINQARQAEQQQIILEN